MKNMSKIIKSVCGDHITDDTAECVAKALYDHGYKRADTVSEAAEIIDTITSGKTKRKTCLTCRSCVRHPDCFGNIEYVCRFGGLTRYPDLTEICENYREKEGSH